MKPPSPARRHASAINCKLREDGQPRCRVPSHLTSIARQRRAQASSRQALREPRVLMDAGRCNGIDIDARRGIVSDYNLRWIGLQIGGRGQSELTVAVFCVARMLPLACSPSFPGPVPFDASAILPHLNHHHHHSQLQHEAVLSVKPVLAI